MSAPAPDPAELNRRKAQEALAHLDALDASPHFAWYVEYVLAPARDDERERALNVAKSAEERDRAAWRHQLAQELCEKPRGLRAMYARQAAAS